LTALPPSPGVRPRILFLAHLLPWPLEGGGQIKSYHTLRILASRYDVTLLAFVRSPGEAANAEPLRPLCAGGIRTVRLARGKARDAALALSCLAGRRSFLIARDDNAEMRRAVADALAGLRNGVSQGADAVHVDHLQMMQFVPPQTPGVPVVLDNHNIEYRIPQRLSETSANPALRLYAGREWPKLRDCERDAVRRADLTLCVSEEDASGLRDLAPSKADAIAPVPIGVDTDYFAPAARTPNSRTLLTIGTMYWPPNVDGMLWFHAEVWPRVRAKVPDARLNVVGAKPVAAIRALAAPDSGIRVTGSVPDVRPYAEDCGAFIVPLLSGSGMRVKILNALAMGLPVVSTTLGAEGIGVEDGKHLLLADAPEAFADALFRLLRGEPELGERLGDAGRRLMEARYSWDAVGRELLALYARRVLPAYDGRGAGAKEL
jgi:polysaccharide biosynthesis protein PslH